MGSIQTIREKMSEMPVFGIFSKVCDPAFVEAVGLGGFDFVILDLEHGPVSTENLQHLIRAAEVGGVTPIVRVKEAPLSIIGEVLDIGAAGVQVPQVRDSETARTILQAAKFSPDGARGVCRFVRAAGYSRVERSAYFARANESLVVIQLEGLEALTNLDAILDTPGIDVVFVGPYDLSQSLGFPGQIDHPTVIEAVSTVVERCAERGVTVGTFVDDVETAHRWVRAGVRYVAFSVDVGVFLDACRIAVSALHDVSDVNV